MPEHSGTRGPPQQRRMMRIDRDMVGLAAEFAVASELGRRNIYAQPTFGHQKRTDLLIFGKSGKLLRVEVKGKQSQQWPNCKGVPDENAILVLVDLAAKDNLVRPDFYVLTCDDWIEFVRKEIRKRPEKKIELDAENVPVWTTEVKGGKPYRGIGIEVKDVSQHLERWERCTQ